jgi:hypothetical protein
MTFFSIDSNHGAIFLGPLYLGWNNTPHLPVNGDYGDETFGICFYRFYLGCYSDGKWAAGILNENGCLP